MTREITLEGKSSDPCFDFTIHQDGRVVPATFWNAWGGADGPAPVVLLQHGGPFHKRHERSDALAQTVVESTGAAVLLIDGPIHGHRRSDELGIMEMLAEFENHWRTNPGIDGMVTDWQIALDAVIGEGWADPDRVAWFGTSMGTAYGIPLCAVEPRIRAAAIGMWGTDWGQEDSLLGSARAMQTPALFQIKAEDEIFSTAGQRALFEALGSPNKCLHTFPGGHSLTAPGQMDELMAFLVDALTEKPKVAVDAD
ncbi:alpha/beta hydrolase family protein [Sphingobium subterraneum]|uniref:Dienelactone hydrolase n=1 Tax=Sphingobium subterraneum TaxID=627688 RepID=A0A841J0G2_9SPHN|nr:hypothetical protein [Sphingobium subterraneum]MBB6123016.1 dienelactone hydrolase [Sphingobium subterraneum]